MMLLLGVAFSAAAADKNKSDSWSEDGVLQMTLELIAVPDNDLQEAQMKLTVTNTGTNDIVLDKTLAAGFSLRFKTDISEEFTRSDEKDVTTKETKKLDQPAPEAGGSRFVAIKPGQSLSRTYDLAGPVRGVVEGHASDMNHIHYGFYYEAMQTYQVPPKAKRLEVDAWYERGVWMMATVQFKEWYGKTAEKIGLWSGRARSNTLVIERK
jgi:hypothetical protein